MALLEAAYIRSDFSFELVAQNSSTDTPAFYKLTAMWSSQAGSLLLWVFLLSVFSSAVLFLTRHRLRDIAPYATAVLGGVGRVLPVPDAVLREPVRHARDRAGRGRRPEPAAAAPGDDVPPADALHGLRRLHDPVRVRDRRADHAPHGRRSGSARRAASRSSPGRSSASGSCSARCGRTPSSAGAATGRGIRSRTRR